MASKLNFSYLQSNQILQEFKNWLYEEEKNDKDISMLRIFKNRRYVQGRLASGGRPSSKLEINYGPTATPTIVIDHISNPIQKWLLFPNESETVPTSILQPRIFDDDALKSKQDEVKDLIKKPQPDPQLLPFLGALFNENAFGSKFEKISLFQEIDQAKWIMAGLKQTKQLRRLELFGPKPCSLTLTFLKCFHAILQDLPLRELELGNFTNWPEHDLDKLTFLICALTPNLRSLTLDTLERLNFKHPLALTSLRSLSIVLHSHEESVTFFGAFIKNDNVIIDDLSKAVFDVSKLQSFAISIPFGTCESGERFFSLISRMSDLRKLSFDLRLAGRNPCTRLKERVPSEKWTKILEGLTKLEVLRITASVEPEVEIRNIDFRACQVLRQAKLNHLQKLIIEVPEEIDEPHVYLSLAGKQTFTSLNVIYRIKGPFWRCRGAVDWEKVPSPDAQGPIGPNLDSQYGIPAKIDRHLDRCIADSLIGGNKKLRVFRFIDDWPKKELTAILTAMFERADNCRETSSARNSDRKNLLLRLPLNEVHKEVVETFLKKHTYGSGPKLPLNLRVI